MKKLFSHSFLFVLFLSAAPSNCSLETISQSPGSLGYAWQVVQDHPVIAGSFVVGALVLAKLAHYYATPTTTPTKVFIHDKELDQMSPWAREISALTAQDLAALNDEGFDAIIDHQDLEQISSEAIGRLFDEQTRRAQVKGLI